jgi:hypothetical protein
VTLTWKVEVDFPNTGTWTDITAYVLDIPGVSRGRARAVDQVQPGTMSLTLDNSDGRFTPGRSSSPYYPNVNIARPIRWSVNTGVQSFLFFGSVDSWTMSWDGGVLGACSVQVTDAFKALSRRISDGFFVDATLQANIGTTSAVYALYPLSEPSGATAVANIQSTNTQPPGQVVASKYGAGTVTFGDQQGFLPGGAPSNTCVTFAHTGTGNTEGMSVVQFAGPAVPTGPVPPASGPWSWSCWFKISAAPPDFASLMSARGAPIQDFTVANGAFNSADVVMDSAGKIHFRMTNAFPSIHSVDCVTAASYADGQWHYVTGSLSSDNVTLNLYVDNTSATATAGFAQSLAGCVQFQCGGQLSQWGESKWGLNGSIAFVKLNAAAVLTATSHQILYSYGLFGYITNSATGNQINSVAQNFGMNQIVSPNRVVADAGVTRATKTPDMAGQSFLSILQGYTTTEQGVLYMNVAGGLIFKARTYRVNQAVAFTLDNAAGDVQYDLAFTEDDTLMANDFTTTWSGGTERVQNPTSVAAYGRYTDNVDTYLTTSLEAVDYSGYRVGQYGTPLPRVSAITIDLLANPGAWATVQNVDIGTRIQLLNLPSEGPAATVDLIVESINWTFTPGLVHQLRMDTSTADITMYMTLDDNTYGLLDNNSLFY